ncbi:MAG: transporter substrate-binding domain-containing protein [Ekhidna sp.]
MKRNLVVFFLLSLSFQLYTQSFNGDTWENARKSGKADIVVTYAEVPKYSEMIDGQPSGICFEIMDHFKEFVESTYGIQVNIQNRSINDPTNWGAFMESVRSSSGGVFGLGDVSITEDRQLQYKFSPPYLANVAILVTNKDVSSLSSIEHISSEFSGMTAVVQRGSSHDKRVQKLQKLYGGFDITYVDNSAEKITTVLSSSRYFTYIDFPNYLESILDGVNIKRHGEGDDAGEKFGILMPKNSDWSGVMRSFFQSNGGYTLSDRYRKSLKDNLGEKILRLTDALAQKD